MSGPQRAAAVTLAACAGAVDLLSLTSLGGAFAGIVTGNLVNIVYGICMGKWGPAASAAIAVLAFSVGALTWAWAWRGESRVLVAPLLAQLGLLLVLGFGWIAAEGRPGAVTGALLLATGAFALGGQSITALRVPAPTTYLTGGLTVALRDLARGTFNDRMAIPLQLIGLLSGAAAAGILIMAGSRLVAFLPALLVTLALLFHAEHLRRLRVGTSP
ncbi:DUF1275 domain-containing protein [Actinocorallia sp. API 0066]|uniref:DUF1275 family protein n=1 Tax=Actinocorallia sp. API 0066 TaxID=2896846 RepID=UPI001E298FE9|nr:DUF1275 family protein [Actinocorallia sp. API 0066]MCD0450003.1 DUF1275 domain-containing protein [Actinocorallia sp. API 0066]